MTTKINYAINKDMRELPIPANLILALIAIPMVGVVLAVRLYTHFVGIRHIYIGEHILHHLIQGVFLVVFAAFVLAFPGRGRLTTSLALVALGTGSGLILDEVSYLVITHATDADYLSPVSLWGSIIFISAALVTLLLLWRSSKG